MGDASYDPTCFRLLRTTGVLTVSRSAKPDMIIPFTDQLYFTDLPPDNTGVLGSVHYTFLALGGTCTANLSPYQEVASGADNEKFNADYGAAVPPLRSTLPDVTIDKSSDPDVVAEGGTIIYTIPFLNSGDSDAGLTLSSGFGVNMPLIISDTVPEGLEYVCGTATSNLPFESPTTDGVTIYYSNDSGQTWSTSDLDIGCSTGNPISTGNLVIQWWLDDPFPANSTGNNYAQFQVAVPSDYTIGGGDPFIENCAESHFGPSTPAFDRACDIVVVEGDNTIGDYVWQDEDNDTEQDAGETGIDGVTVSLYWDRNGDGFLDSGDVLIGTQDTSGGGSYDFTLLPDGDYLVQVDNSDSDLPTGYNATTAEIYAVDLNDPGDIDYNDADFGFGPVLQLSKNLISSDPAYEGEEVSYTIILENTLSGDGEPPGPCTYEAWASTSETGVAGKSWLNDTALLGAPDGAMAIARFADAGEWVTIGNFDLASAPSGNIAKVEVIIPIVVTPTLAGTLDVDLVAGAVTTNSASYNAASLVNSTLAVDVTDDRNWAWSDFEVGGPVSVTVTSQKTANPDGDLGADAVGFRISTGVTCGFDEMINPLPVSDTYDDTLLQFISATPPETDSSTPGTITWDNVGPLYGGQTKTITVTFKALEPPDTDVPLDGEPDPTTHQNCANSTGATFLDGDPVNDASDCVTHGINPAGTIGDFVWNDIVGDGTYDSDGADNIPGNADDEKGIAGVTYLLNKSG